MLLPVQRFEPPACSVLLSIDVREGASHGMPRVFSVQALRASAALFWVYIMNRREGGYGEKLGGSQRSTQQEEAVNKRKNDRKRESGRERGNDFEVIFHGLFLKIL